MSLITCLQLVFVFTKAAEWNYDESSGYGPSHWSTYYSECGGDRQSPINIMTDDDSDVQEIEELDYSETCSQENYIKFTLTHSTFKIYNNGHGFTMVPVNETGHELRSNTLSIGRLQNTYDTGDDVYHSEYCWDSLHFHFGPNSSVGSEHLLNNTFYPLEGHFVFYSCNYENIAEALGAYVDESADVDANTQSDTNVLAVLGIFFDVKENNDLDNEAFIQISSSINDILSDETDPQYITVDMSGFFGGSEALTEIINSVYIYQGSLTTPPCLEAVLWHVSTKVLSISQTQLESFFSLAYSNSTTTMGDFGNWRPVQNVNDRTLYEQECETSNSFTIFKYTLVVLISSSIMSIFLI